MFIKTINKMANGKKTYEIVINGIQQSIDAVESLNKSLDTLEKRIDALAKKNVNVSMSGGDSTARTKALEEEDKLLRQIEELHRKVADTERQEYQELLHAKEELKEYQTIAKSVAAQTNLDQGINDTSTMAGMKAQLKDIKAAMQTIDVESDKFKQMQQEANELNNKLKEIEQGYGQFGRNVGNYANGVAEGMSKYKVQIGDTVREFDSAKQAAKELSNELLNLPKGADGAQELRKAIQSIKSDIKDLAASSNAMDNLLDTMQSFTAIGSVAEGFSALFGFDNDAIEQSIQKLVALQNVMQGLEQLNQQMNTGEGIMGWISKGNDAIDSLAAKITGASKAQKTLNTETTAGATAAKGLAAAETAQAAATTTATVATKALSLALKSIGIGLVISLVATLVTYWKDIYQWFVDTVPALRNLSTWFDKIIAVASGVGNAIINYMVQPLATLVKTIQAVIDGNFSEIPKIISEGVKKTFNVVGNFQKGYHKATERQQEKHNKKMREQQLKANEEQLKDEEAKYGTSHRRTQEYYRKQMALVDKNSREYKEYQRRLWEDERREREENERRRLKDAKDAAKNNSEILQAEKQAQEKIINLRIALMKDGLAKELAQLKENNRKEVEEIEKNGRNVEEQLKLQAQKYEQEREKIYKSYWDETYQLITDNEIQDFENKIDVIEQKIKEISETSISFNLPITSEEAESIFSHDYMLGAGRRNKTKREIYGLSNEDGAVLERSLKERFDRLNTYLKSVVIESNNLIADSYDESLKKLNKEEQKQIDEIKKQIAEVNEQAKNIGIKFDEPGYRKYLETIKNENRDTYTEMEKQGISYLNRLEALEQQEENITQEYANKRTAINNEMWDRQAANYEKYYGKELDALNDFFNKAQSLAEKQPIYKDGFINVNASKKNYNEALDTVNTIINRINKDKINLSKQLEEGLISPDTYTKTLTSLFSLEEAAKNTRENIQKDVKKLLPDLLRQIEDVFQILGQAATQVIQSIGQINDAAFEKEMEALDKQSEALEEQLDKQRELTQKYANDVEGIEDELATARGDRRQHLIDQLNAQMAAQRESLAQEKRIEKEQEKLDKKREKLEEDNNKRKKSQAITTALINAALAISNAAVNTWPIPAIPMIAAATAVGAAQIAAVKAAKYADGGVLQGKSHRQGGIKVLGGSAEVEGGEYITNKRTTAKNVDLLEYINSKKRRVDLSDMIEFYAEKPKANIRNISKRYFADGGYVPTLRNDITINDRLINAMEDYSERPVYVEVVDIMNKADNVRQVRTLAGIE